MLRKKVRKRLKRFCLFAIFLFIMLFGAYYTVKLLYPVKYGELVLKYSNKYDLDPYLVLAVIKVESSYRPEAVSPKNARGLMQISEKTGKWAADKLQIADYDDEALFIPEVNINIGCWYLSVLYSEFKDTDLVLAAYNGGSGNVSQWLKDSRLSSDGKRLDEIPFKETEQYLKKVKCSRRIYKKLYENMF